MILALFVMVKVQAACTFKFLKGSASVGTRLQPFIGTFNRHQAHITVARLAITRNSARETSVLPAIFEEIEFRVDGNWSMCFQEHLQTVLLQYYRLL